MNKGKERARVGVFSGTFDPFHVGHLESCLVAKSVCNLETVLIAIEKTPHRKQKVTSFKHRAEIIDRSTNEYPGLQMIDVNEDHVTTKNTLQVLENRFADHEYWYILGSDLFEHMPTWDDFDNIIENFHLCIVLRTNRDRKKIEQAVRALQKQSPHTKCEVLPEVWSELSSSQVRADFAIQGTSAAVHRAATDYIKKHQLYVS